MGTRADFYVGRGLSAEWIGSIAWDGYPEGIDALVLDSENEEEYREAVTAFFEPRDDVTLPEQGWPWPWENSHTTDYAYAFDSGEVWASCFGNKWFDPTKIYTEEEEQFYDGDKVDFPDMEEFSAPAGSKRSGVILISA